MHILHIYILQTHPDQCCSFVSWHGDERVKWRGSDFENKYFRLVREYFYQKKLAYLHHVIRRTSLAEENELINEKWEFDTLNSSIVNLIMAIRIFIRFICDLEFVKREQIHYQ